MRILLTGFEAFGPVKVNPSSEIVGTIAARARASGDKDLFTAILPTEYTAAARKIRRLIRRIRPAVVICLGVAASRKTISLERVALNLDDEVLPDNVGQARAGRRIVRAGPAAYWSTLPLERLRKAIENTGTQANFSNSAGTYVCNHVFYVARHETERMKAAQCGFIHVPGISNLGKNSKAAAKALDSMVSAVESCLETLRKTESASKNKRRPTARRS